MNILFPEQSVLTGAASNRLYQPLFKLAELDRRTQILCLKADAKDKMSDKDFNNLFWGADVLMTYFPGGPDENFKELENLKLYNADRIKLGRAPLQYVVDMDDWLTACSPFNESFVFTGTEEKAFTFENDAGEVYEKKWFQGDTVKMRDKDVAFDIERNKKLVEAKHNYIKGAHAVTVTTDALAEKVRTLNPNVYVLPNAIDFELYEPLPKNGKEIRIGYVYSGSHRIDWLDLLPYLREVINKTPFIKLVLMGAMPVVTGLEMNKIEFHPYVNILDGYHKAFSNLRLDIGICALFEDEFNSCRSELKMNEYAAVKAAPLVPEFLYGKYAKDGKTALVYKNKKEFVEKLKLLIWEKQTRNKIAEEAFTYTKQNYDINVIAPKYYEAFEKIMEKGRCFENEEAACITV